MKLLGPLLPALALTACASAVPDARRPQAIAPPRPIATIPGLDKIVGRDARALISMFGPAAQDVREADARRLQFAGTACVLDAYLYPPARGKEPVVTHVDARTSDGRAAERVSCATALSKGR